MSRLKSVFTFTETSREFLREAMKEGYVHIRLVKVIVVGPAGVGKTCFIYLLLSKSPPSPEERESTGCAERSVRVIRVGKEGKEWSEIPTQGFQEMIAEAVPILYEELKSKGKGIEELDEILSELEGEEEGEGKEEEESEEEREAKGEGQVEGEGDMEGEGEGEGKIEKNEEGDKEKKQEVGKKQEENESSSETKSGGDSKAAIDGVIQKLTKLVSSGKTSHRLLDMELIYITDCGGQQPFWDLIPIFTYDTSATVFIHRLCEKLDEHPLNDVYKRGQRVGPSQRATLTTAEAFKTILRGLHEGEKRSKIITVGSHRDLIAECEETPEEKNKKFVTIASPHFTDDVLYRDEGMKEVIFKVNTIDPTVDDEKEASKIRAVIEESAVEHEIPIWWFILQLILEALARKLNRNVLSKSECIHVSSSFGFSEGQLDAALAFFDKLNIFLYKKDIIPNVVFTNAQVPLDRLSELVKKHSHLKAAEADPSIVSGRAKTGDWQKFRDNGILTLKILTDLDFEAHYIKGIFTANDFLDLIKGLLVVSPLSETEYFFPAILNMTAEAHIHGYLEQSKATKIAPLVVWFPTGWAPPGVYCCTICHLQSYSQWDVVTKPRTTSTCSNKDTQLRHVSRNCITFTKHNRPGSVTVIDNFSFFITCVNVDSSKMKEDDLQEHCQAIRCELFAAVEAALKNTHHTNSHPKDAFLCPRQSESCSSELHVAHISEIGKQWICSENKAIFSNFTPDQTVWLSGQGEVLQAMKYVCMFVFSFSSVYSFNPHWQFFSTKYGRFSKSLCSNYSTQVGKCCLSTRTEYECNKGYT